MSAVLRRRRALVAALVVSTWWIVGAWSATAAGAHAVLVSQTPAADAVLDSSPPQVLLEFSESVSAPEDAVTLLGPDGGEIEPTASDAADTTVTAELPDLEQQGSYTVTWKVVSADGHPIRGAYLFHLGERTLDEPAGGTDGGGTPMSANVLRAVGASLALGGLAVLFTTLLGGSAPVRRRAALSWSPVVAGTALLGVGALAAVGGPPGDALSVVLDTTSGRMCALALGVALLGQLAGVLRAPTTLQLALAAATVPAVAAQGHAVSLPPVPLSAGLTVVHVAAALLWVCALLWLLRRGGSDPGETLMADVRRLSPYGIAVVLALAVSGVVLVLQRVPVGELLTSGYGRLSLLKSALLVVAVVMALRNRFRVTPTDDAARLVRSVRVEVVVLALALVAGTVLAQVRPPEEGAGAPAGGVYVERVEFGEGQVELLVEPGNRGTNEMHVTALGPDGRLMEGADDLALSMSLPSADVGPLEPEMQRITTGHSVAYTDIPLAGEWQVRVTSRPSRFEELRADFVVPVGG